ncbi:PKD domain-containing protein, partial [mine drainage metagenome]
FPIAANTTSGLGPLSVQFSSSVLGGSEYSYNWSFGNGHHSLNPDPSYTFPTGNYTVNFRVTSANGASGERTIAIQSLPSPVSFIYSSGLNITQEFHFKAVPNWDASGPYNVSWSFPDGRTLTGMNISYKFPVYQELNPVIVTFNYGNNSFS